MKERIPGKITPPQLLVHAIPLIGMIALLFASYPSLAVMANAQSDNDNNNPKAAHKNAERICSKAILQQLEQNPNRALPSFCRDVIVDKECTLEITTDKETYGPGETVRITVTNIGDEPLEFPNSGLGLQIRNSETGAEFPLFFLDVITILQPGESRTFEFTYEDLVSQIGTGTIQASVGGGGECASVTFTLVQSDRD